jgi:hypothetical protein
VASHAVYHARRARGLCIACGHLPGAKRKDGSRGTLCHECRGLREQQVSARRAPTIAAQRAAPTVETFHTCRRCGGPVAATLASTLCRACRQAERVALVYPCVGCGQAAEAGATLCASCETDRELRRINRGTVKRTFRDPRTGRTFEVMWDGT